MTRISAEVDQFGKQAAIASLRVNPWRNLGTTFDKPVSTSKMLDLAHLANWNLRFVDAAEVMPDYRFSKPVKFVVRDNPFEPGKKDVIGTVGKRYKIFPNEEILDFGDLLTNGNRRWETAGAGNGGARIFATLAEPNDIVLDPGGSADVVKRYLMLTSTHDGSSTLLMKKVNTRIDCTNVISVAMKEIGDEFRIRHTEGMASKLEDAKLALKMAADYDEVFEAEMQKMIETEVKKDKFWEIVKTVYPEPEDNLKGRLSKWSFKTDALMTIWNGGTGSMDNLEDTAWKAFNTLTEHQQWFREVRAGKEENFWAAGAGFDNVTNDTQTNLFNVVRAMA